jgi:hypothetical protein
MGVGYGHLVGRSWQRLALRKAGNELVVASAKLIGLFHFCVNAHDLEGQCRTRANHSVTKWGEESGAWLCGGGGGPGQEVRDIGTHSVCPFCVNDVLRGRKEQECLWLSHGQCCIHNFCPKRQYAPIVFFVQGRLCDSHDKTLPFQDPAA